MEIAEPARRKIVKNYESNQYAEQTKCFLAQLYGLPDCIRSNLFMIQRKRQSVVVFSIDSYETGCILQLQYFYCLVKFKNVTNGTSQLSQTQLALLLGLMVHCYHIGD